MRLIARVLLLAVALIAAKVQGAETVLQRARAASEAADAKYKKALEASNREHNIKRLRLQSELCHAQLDAVVVQIEVLRLESELAAHDYQRALDGHQRSPELIRADELEQLRLQAAEARRKFDEEIGPPAPAAPEKK